MTEIHYTAGSFSYEAVNALLEDLRAARAALADREQELLEIRGACRNPSCRLHFAHRGLCPPSGTKGG